MIRQVRRTAKDTASAERCINVLVGCINEQRTLSGVNRTIQNRLSHIIKQCAVTLLTVLQQQIKTVVQRGVGVGTIGGTLTGTQRISQRNRLGGLRQSLAERILHIIQNRIIERQCDSLSDLGSHHVQIVQRISPNGFSRRHKDRCNLVRHNILLVEVALSDRLLTALSNPLSRNITGPVRDTDTSRTHRNLLCKLLNDRRFLNLREIVLSHIRFKPTRKHRVGGLGDVAATIRRITGSRRIRCASAGGNAGRCRISCRTKLGANPRRNCHNNLTP